MRKFVGAVIWLAALTTSLAITVGVIALVVLLISKI